MSGSPADDFVSLFAEMMKNPPDPKQIPIINRRGTALGLVIPLHILSWLAVGFRLYTRVKVVRDPGIDDVLVFIAAVLNVVGMTALFIGLEYGMGHHLIFALPVYKPTMIWYYVANATYTQTTLFIKLSLLFQYRRTFHDKYRRICITITLVIAILWGLAFSFMAWFPCFPVKAFWSQHTESSHHCYGYGYRSLSGTKATLLSFSATNMFLDIIILAIPLTAYFKPDLGKKQILAMTGLFALGFLAVLMALLRLWAGFRNARDPIKLFDFTFWLPEVLIFSNLEINFAIMCASMPIFWPAILATWNHIFVTKEVLVTHDRCSVTHETQIELDRASSMKSASSKERLVSTPALDGKAFYYEFDAESGRMPGAAGNRVDVQSHS